MNANIDSVGEKVADAGGEFSGEANVFDNHRLSVENPTSSLGRIIQKLLLRRQKKIRSSESGRLWSRSRNELAIFLEHHPRCFLSMCHLRDCFKVSTASAERSFQAKSEK